VVKITLSEQKRKQIEEEILQEVLHEITEIEVEKGEIPKPPVLYLVRKQKFFKRVFAIFLGLTLGIIALKIAVTISVILTKKGWFVG
jgi:hypothetical protein